MSHVDPGPLASYGSLSDPNLTAYFSNSRMRRHLVKSGLVTRKGEIVSEKVFRLNNARKEHQRHVRDILAQAIVHKALDMERHRQMQIKRQLEEIGKVERVRRVRADRALRGDEDILPLLSPPSKKAHQKKPKRPHTAPSGHSSKHISSDSSDVGSQLPQSIGYPAIPGDSPFYTRSTRIKTPYPNVEIDNQHLSQLDQEALRSFTLNLSNYNLGSGVSPYTVPVLDPASREFVQPPKTKKPKRLRQSKRPTTAPGAVKKKEQFQYPRANNKRSLALHRHEPPMIYRTQSRSMCLITFKYLGQIVNLDHESEDPRDEITVDQQHCGGGNLCVYRGKLVKGDNFTVISQRHRGFPFSLTFYLNGIMVERLSVCCEYKHKKGNKLGAKTSHFGFVKVEGAHPCYKCLVASERLRTTPDQSTEKPNAFRKQEYTIKRRRSSQPKPPPPVKPKEEEKYEDSFASSDESSSVSSVSTLTSSEDEEKETTPKSPIQREKSKSPRRTPSPKPRISSPKTPKSNRSSSSSTDSGSEDQHIPVRAGTPKAEQKPIRAHSSSDSASSNSSSSGSSLSDEEEEAVHYENPSLLEASTQSLIKQGGFIDASNYELSETQVSELCSILKEDSLSFVSLTLYNCNLNENRLNEILNTVATFCNNLKFVKLGRNKAVCMDALLRLAQLHSLESLILDDSTMKKQEIDQLMEGMKLLYKPSKKRKIAEKPMHESFNQLTLLAPSSPTSDESEEPSLKCLSLNRVGMTSDGITSLAGFLSINPYVTALHLNSNSLTGDCVLPLWKVLSSGKNHNLHTLTLSGNKLSDKSIEKFSDLMSNPSFLQKLDFSGNGLSEASGSSFIEFAEKNPSIKHLYVARGNNIKRKTVKKIKQAVASKKFK